MRLASGMGVVKTKHRLVRWVLTPDEAEELAEFIEKNVHEGDVALQDVAALRGAVDVIRSHRPSPATRHRQQPAPGSAVRTD
jgi:hypothetical protein